MKSQPVFTKREEVLRGFHANIPMCCIAFFVETWIPRWRGYDRGVAKDAQYLSRHESRLKKLGRRRPGYVPCLVCIRKKVFKRLHKCMESCKGKPGNTYVKSLAIMKRNCRRGAA